MAQSGLNVKPLSIAFDQPMVQGGFKTGVGTARSQDFLAKTEILGTSRPHPGFRVFLDPPHP
jgi:hypothetical protein